MSNTEPTPLTTKKCRPCEGEVDRLDKKEADKLKDTLSLTWEYNKEAAKITRTFTFPAFSDAIGFIQTVAEVAEAEGHHPDIFLHDYNNVDISLSTHAIKGLSENDFIVASKIEQHVL